MEKLFKLVFNNIVLLRLIFRFVRLYKKNEHVVFKYLDNLREYKEKEYIKSIVIHRGYQKLKFGDLPNDGVIEIFNFGNTREETPLLSLLPSSVHTVKNVVVLNNVNQDFTITPNITSISFYNCPNISGENRDGCGFIKIPNTIKTLKFHFRLEKRIKPFKKGDIPFGITKLTLYNVPNAKDIYPDSLTSLKTSIITKNISLLVLPNSLSHLSINYYCMFEKCKDDFSDGLFDLIPINLESLVFRCYSNIKPTSNLFKLTTIKKLSLEVCGSDQYGNRNKIHPNSLPSSSNLTELTLLGVEGTIGNNTIPNFIKTLKIQSGSECWCSISNGGIPNSVTSLSINNIIEQPNILPESLTHLELHGNPSIQGDINIYTIENMSNMISLLPNSITSLSLPDKCKQFNITIPQSIVNLKYNKIKQKLNK